MALPLETSTPGIQELYTREHGTVKVAGISFMDGGFHIVKSPNGAYMHSNGLPVSSEDQLRAALPPEFLDEALNWWNNRHSLEENPPRPITFHREGYPIFADGSVPDFSDLYAFFAPGPILTAAIIALQQYHDRKPGQVIAQPQPGKYTEAPEKEAIEVEAQSEPPKAKAPKKSHKKKK